jgi:hypothetical protein
MLGMLGLYRIRPTIGATRFGRALLILGDGGPEPDGFGFPVRFELRNVDANYLPYGLPASYGAAVGAGFVIRTLWTSRKWRRRREEEARSLE